MDFIENMCEQCLYFEGDLSTGNCDCTNGALDENESALMLGMPDWEECCEGFAPNELTVSKTV